MGLPTVELYCADCLDKLPEIPSESVDAVITDSPYPCIKRKYGYWTVDEWWALIVEGVIPEVRRILKPTGSAVFILQPNSEHVGQMRGWLWEFMAWVCREWNMVQDVWWWNHNMCPTVHTQERYGLMRPSLTACVWAGSPNCYRSQEQIWWSETKGNAASRAQARWELEYSASNSTHHLNRARCAAKAEERGGKVTPYNVIPLAPVLSQTIAHCASTPLKLADWWTRYICPPGGTVCDPFMGSGTMGVAAVNNGCNFVGIEKLDEPGYFPTAQERIAEAQAEPQQVGMQL